MGPSFMHSPQNSSCDLLYHGITLLVERVVAGGRDSEQVQHLATSAQVPCSASALRQVLIQKLLKRSCTPDPQALPLPHWCVHSQAEPRHSHGDFMRQAAHDRGSASVGFSELMRNWGCMLWMNGFGTVLHGLVRGYSVRGIASTGLMDDGCLLIEKAD